MAESARLRARLAQAIERGEVDDQDADRRNSAMPGVLGDLWRDFLALPTPERLRALSQDAFKGMHWQSLLQCSPFFLQSESRSS